MPGGCWHRVTLGGAQGTRAATRTLPLSFPGGQAQQPSALIRHWSHLVDLNELEFLDVEHISVLTMCDVTALCSGLPGGQKWELQGQGLDQAPGSLDPLTPAVPEPVVSSFTQP